MRLPLVVRGAVSLTLLLTLSIVAVMVATKAGNANPYCLDIIGFEETAFGIQPRSFNYATIDPLHRKIIRPAPATDIFGYTFDDTRHVKISPDGKRIAMIGADTIDPNLSHFRIVGAGATFPLIFETTFPFREGLFFEWLPNSNYLRGSYRPGEIKGEMPLSFAIDMTGKVQTGTVLETGMGGLLHMTKDGNMLTLAGDEFRLWSADTMKELGRATMQPVFSEGGGYPHLSRRPNSDEFGYLTSLMPTALAFHLRSWDKELIFPVILVSPESENIFDFGVSIDWSPDGNYFIVSVGYSTSYMYLIDVKNGGKLIYQDYFFKHDCMTYCGWPYLAWKPDGSGFIFAAKHNNPPENAFFLNLSEYDIASGRITPVFERAGEFQYLPNRWLWINRVDDDYKWRVSAISDQKTIHLHETDHANYAEKVFAPDQNAVAIYGFDKSGYKVTWINFREGTFGTVPARRDGRIGRWSSNGQIVAYETDDNLKQQSLWTLNIKTGEYGYGGVLPSLNYAAQPSNNGRLVAIAYHHQTNHTFGLEVRDAQIGRPIRVFTDAEVDTLLLPTEWKYAQIEVSPDARFVGLITPNQVAVGDIQTGRVSRYAKPHTFYKDFKLRWSNCR